MRILLTFIGILISVSICESASKFHPHGRPEGTPSSNYLLENDIYSMSYNPVTKMADWVAYDVTTKNISDYYTRRRSWSMDPRVPKDKQLESSDYDNISNISMDRGHQVPLGSFVAHQQWNTTNYITNITPQMSYLNRGPWKRLEEYCRSMLDAGFTVNVLTGPYYLNDKYSYLYLPESDEDHSIPSGYWKVVIFFRNGNRSIHSFIFPQDAKYTSGIFAYVTYLDNVEVLSKLKIFPEMTKRPKYLRPGTLLN